MLPLARSAEKYFHSALLILVLLACRSAAAQELNGVKIQMNPDALTILKFNAEVRNFEFGKSDIFTAQVQDDIKLRIKSLTANPTPTNLTITEGNRTHVFIIEVVKKIDINTFKGYYDYSDLKAVRKMLAAGAKVATPSPTASEAPDNKEPVMAQAGRQEQQKQKERDEQALREKQAAKADAEKKAAATKAEQQRLAQEKAARDQAVKDEAKRGQQLEKENRQALAAAKKREEEEDKIRRAEEQKAKAQQAKRDKEIAAAKEKDRQALIAKAAAQKAAEEKQLKLAAAERAAKRQREEEAARKRNEELEAEKKTQAAAEKKRIAEEVAARKREAALEAEARKQEDIIRRRQEELAEEEQRQAAQARRDAERADALIKNPYWRSEWKKKYPKINFAEPPQGQSITGEYYLPKDTLANSAAAIKVVSAPARSIEKSERIGGVRMVLESINLSGVNAFFRIRIINSGKEDFLAGKMMMSWWKKEGGSYFLIPCYITEFPVVYPGREATIVYGCRGVNAGDKDAFSFSMKERLSDKEWQIPFTGATYNKEINR
jgi:chemotaxis protein histidine kinase CheA